MKTRKRALWSAVLFPGILGGILLVSADLLSAAPTGVLKQAIHWGLSAEWLDPATSNVLIPGQLPLYLFHDALLKPMPGNTYGPCLAESWNISSDFKVYEFKLRKGVKFHNGDPVTAEDAAFSFWRYKASQAKIVQGKTEKVDAVNPQLVRFIFKQPFPDFLEYLLPGATTIGWVVPKKYIEKVGEAGFKKHPIGCGPYKFVEFFTGVKLIAEANEEYWKKVPSIKRLEFHIVSEPATRVAMVRRGEVDIATHLQGIFYEDVKKDPKLRLIPVQTPTRWLAYITSQWDPKSPWFDPRVRRAASLAIDRKTLADIHMPGCGPIGEIGLEGDPFVTPYPADPYDPERAKKLLAEAGYPKGFSGGKFYPYEGGYWPYGEQVANYWKAVGITVDTVLLDRPAWFANRQGGKMKGGIFIDNSQPATIGGRLLYLFGSASYGNYPEIQSLWDQYQREVGAKQRQEMMIQIQKLIHDKTMFIPLTSNNTPAALGPRVKGDPFKIQPLIWFTAPFEEMEIQ